MASTTKQYQEKRYTPIGEYLSQLPPSKSEVTLTFAQVEELVGKPLPRSAHEHREWWANQERGSRSYHWQDVGFKTGSVDMDGQKVRFYRDVSITASLPRPLTLQQAVTEVNEAAKSRHIGGLQKWRKQNTGQERTGASTVFYATVDPKRNWVSHAGGLLELQFNLGFETIDDIETFRHGVAFSLQATRELRDVEPMRPKIARFNEYVRANPDYFDGLSMWRWANGRTANYPIEPIPASQIHMGSFIFIGAMQPAERISVEWILDDFDRLLPLYEFVEGGGTLPERRRAGMRKGFVFTPGNKAKAARGMFQRRAAKGERDLRHNMLQDALFNHLEEIHGEDNTSGEQDCGNRTLIDVAVRNGDEHTYYELKTAASAQQCIREALGQLLEYSHWPGAQRAMRFVVVGTAPRDSDTTAYIKALKRDFSLPLEYQQFDEKFGRLIDA